MTEDNKSVEIRRGDSHFTRFTPHPPLCGILTAKEGFLLVRLAYFRTPHPPLCGILTAKEGFLLVRLSKSVMLFPINCRDRRPRRSENKEYPKTINFPKHRRGDTRIARFTPHPSLVKLVTPSPAGEGFLLVRLSKSVMLFPINCRDRRPRRSKKQ